MNKFLEPSVNFNWSEVEPCERSEEANGFKLRQLSHFLTDHVVVRHLGKLPPERTIVTRLIVFQALLDSDPNELQIECIRRDGVLAAIARKRNCSRAWLSKIAVEFSDSLGIHAHWQRGLARGTYAKRATAVHAGTYTASDKHERRKLRERKRAAG